jgi:hypothetical protein
LIDEYARGKDVDPAAYGAFIAVYSSAVAAYAALYRRSGRRLPEGPTAGDMALLGAATFKLARLIAKDKVTSFLRFPFTRYKSNAPAAEVNEEPQGQGFRRRIGEMISCPFCVGQWAGTALMGIYLLNPPAGRAVAGLLSAVGGGRGGRVSPTTEPTGLLSAVAISDGLQYADTALHKALEG